MSTKLSRYVSYALLGVAGVGLYGVIDSYRGHRNMLKNWVKTEAIVMKHSTVDGLINGSSIHFAYYAKHNDTLTLLKANNLNNEGSGETKEMFLSRFPIGHRMNIYYDPQNVKRSHLARDVEYVPLGMMWGFGSLAVVCGLSSFIILKNARPLAVLPGIIPLVGFIIATKGIKYRLWDLDDIFHLKDNGGINSKDKADDLSQGNIRERLKD